MSKEKVKAILTGELSAQVEVGLLVVQAFLFIGYHLYSTTLSRGPQVAFDRLLECLVGGSHDIVNAELNRAYQVMAFVVI